MLGDYLKSLSGKKREAGKHDCCTFMADWCLLNGFLDPMSDFRGKYNSEENGLELIESEGGLESLSSRMFSSIGLNRRLENARGGDIGIVSILGHEAGSIFTGKRWAFVGGSGLAFSHVDNEFILSVWAMS